MHVLAAGEGGPIQATFGSFETNSLWAILLVSLLALGFAYYLVCPETKARLPKVELFRDWLKREAEASR